MSHLTFSSKHYLEIIKHLRDYGGEARIIGGAVRDAILGISGADIDIATDLLPDDVTTALNNHNIKVIPTGIKFGTVTAFIKGESFEITTLRRDISCDGRRANVEYTNDFEEDAERRDFTINSISYCPFEDKIYDYFGGIQDIKQGKVVFIGDAHARIREDYLRILRFFRFSCRYAKNVDKDALNACIDNKSHLPSLSRERIKSEVDLLILLPNSSKILLLMYESGILSELFPKWQYDEKSHSNALKFAKSFSVNLNKITIYTMMCMHLDYVSYPQLLGFKFSRSEANEIIKMLKFKDIKNLTKLELELKKIWIEDKSYEQYFVFSSLIADDVSFILNLYQKLKNIDKPVFPVTGRDIMSLGYYGKEVGKYLDLMKQKWIMSDFVLDKSSLIKLAKDHH
ncbi:CCA tRNA nucleotidyltransferase [Rickettsiaceae bacterium]|nr:CCA tRNA nucleotidyltransferase [Rickettsiaceae bacterium]